MTIMQLEGFDVENDTVKNRGKEYKMKMAQLAKALLGLLEDDPRDNENKQAPKVTMSDGPGIPEAA